jgi:aspartate aminotransferase
MCNVAQVLTDPELRKLWLGEVKTMADRIIDMRAALREGLKKV